MSEHQRESNDNKKETKKTEIEPRPHTPHTHSHHAHGPCPPPKKKGGGGAACCMHILISIVSLKELLKELFNANPECRLHLSLKLLSISLAGSDQPY